MANETIELLKGYEPSKMAWPAYMSEKLDGVPTRLIMGRFNGVPTVAAMTRQGEYLASVDHLRKLAGRLLGREGSSITGELYVRGLPFKEISGLVRQHAPAPELRLYVFDADLNPGFEQTYEQRIRDVGTLLTEYAFMHNMEPEDLPITMIPIMTVQGAEEAEAIFALAMAANPQSEGVVLHSKSKLFQPGKRCWGTQRMKPQPTLDLEVDSYEEAISKTGEPLNMVGRINVKYERHDKHGIPTKSVIGVGPGAMTHDERRRLWEAQADPAMCPYGAIIEVKYMQDNTYEALRQPTFVRFRPDKTVPDVHHV